MEAHPKVSVIVASRERPADLARCLTALGQVVYPQLEIIVVADGAGRDAVARHRLGDRVKVVPNDLPGISAARNLGVDASGGEVLAFLDDDAVPEPMWLAHLVAPFADTRVAAATGHVRGRNGISFQWHGRRIGTDASHGQIETDASEGISFPGLHGGAVMLEGTNMALRRSALETVGGFDPAYRFLFDDADMALRIAASGARTAIAPLAEVHHAFSPSVRRRADRMPTDLWDAGRSLAVFLRRHAGEDVIAGRIDHWRRTEWRRIVGHMVAGGCEPADVDRILSTFDRGVAEGVSAELARLPPVGAPRAFLQLRDGPPPTPGPVLAGRPWSRRALHARARDLAQSGRSPSVYIFSPTALYHRVVYHDLGFWEQRGGLFGRSVRSGAMFRITSFGNRVRREVRRVAKARGIADIGP